jgi:tetratricopeptide (TPR) repeat protein
MYGDALAASVTAGLEAERVYAFAEARVQFERALELRERVAPPPGSLPMDDVALLAHAAQAARWSGDDERAIARCRQALDRLDHAAEPVRAALLYGRLGEYLFWDDEAALECIGKALALLPPGAGAERASLLAAEGRALMGMRRLAEARERCEAAGAIARVTLGLVLAYLGEPEAGEAQIRQALAAAEAADAGEDMARAYMHLGDVLRMRGRHAQALDAMIAGEAGAARFGMRASFGNFMYVNGADDLVRLGRWEEARDRLPEAERIDLGVTGQALHRATAGQLLALTGETEAARAQLRQAGESADALPSEFVAPIHGAWAALALAEHDPEAALGHVETAFATVGEATDPLYTPQLHGLGARAHADLAQAADAARLLADLDRLLARAGDAVHDHGARLATRLAEIDAVSFDRDRGEALRQAQPEPTVTTVGAAALRGGLQGDVTARGAREGRREVDEERRDALQLRDDEAPRASLVEEGLTLVSDPAHALTKRRTRVA